MSSHHHIVHHQAHAEVLRLTTSFTDSLTAANRHLLIDYTNSLQMQQQQRFTITNNANISDIKAIEHPTLKVPYEILNKKFRVAQKNLDRSVSHVTNSINDLERGLTMQVDGEDGTTKKSGGTIESITGLLAGVIDKLNSMKRKSSESINDELESAAVCKKRLEHLKDYCNKANSRDAMDVIAVKEWKKKRLDRMLVEHLLRCGYYDTAIQLGTKSGISDLTNIDLFIVSRSVEESLRNRETSKCLDWCYDNKSKLRKIRSTLEFNLRQQEFIELVRQRKLIEGIKHVRKYLSSLDDVEQQHELQHVMGLLACKPDTNVEPYKTLFDESRWTSLVDEFRQENFKLFQLSSTSVFSVTLQSGLSALKTPQCYRRDGVRVPDCPVCSDLMNKLAVTLPCAHCSQSRLVCAISGLPLNEHNQPMMLPNGHVYGIKALTKMAIENDGKITCPRTKRIYSLAEAEKVFVM